MSVQFPLEVILLIILYIPFTRLRILCEEDNSLMPLIAPILYRYVEIGDMEGWYTTFHNVTILEFNQLASGNIDARIEHLKITESLMISEEYKARFWQIITDSSEYFCKIPIIDYEGDFDVYMEHLPTQNLRHLSFSLCSFEVLPIDFFPPNITDLTIDVLEIINFPPLPTSLKHLKLEECPDDDTPLVFEFPHNLELFSIRNGTFSDELPEGLLKLETNCINGITLPDSLIELEIDKADPLLTFPVGLKKLKLHEFNDLAGILFPCNLEVLDLDGADVTTLDGVVFPSLLKELRLDRNRLRLNNDMFPNLELLDITLHSTGYFSNVRFPKLEYLMACGLVVEDWFDTILPETLKVLEMDVMKEPRTLKFPPYLKLLKIYFRNSRAQYSDLQLPDTLEELCFIQGVSSIFDWNLPLLRSMTITEFCGPIKVPESVVDLCLRHKNIKSREQIVLPPYVERLDISYPLEEYPATVTDLKIRDSDMKSYLLPPNVQKLEIPYPLETFPATVTDLTIGYANMKSFPLPPNVEKVYVSKGELDGSLFTPPNSLNCFCGSFNGVFNTPSNWDTEYQYYAEFHAF